MRSETYKSLESSFKGPRGIIACVVEIQGSNQTIVSVPSPTTFP
ncbi:unnamed protein product, partial [Brassica rapa subsp. narinosa]